MADSVPVGNFKYFCRFGISGGRDDGSVLWGLLTKCSVAISLSDSKLDPGIPKIVRDMPEYPQAPFDPGFKGGLTKTQGW